MSATLANDSYSFPSIVEPRCWAFILGGLARIDCNNYGFRQVALAAGFCLALPYAMRSQHSRSSLRHPMQYACLGKKHER